LWEPGESEGWRENCTRICYKIIMKRRPQKIWFYVRCRHYGNLDNGKWLYFSEKNVFYSGQTIYYIVNDRNLTRVQNESSFVIAFCSHDCVILKLKIPSRRFSFTSIVCSYQNNRLLSLCVGIACETHAYA